MRLYLNRFFRAARLDAALYQEVVANPVLLNQAWITVLIYCMAASWGSFGGVGAVGTNIAMVSTLIGWLAKPSFGRWDLPVRPARCGYWVGYRAWALSF